MSRSNKQHIETIDPTLMKINELINSIFAMNQPTLIDQLQTCSKIVSQLLQNQLVNHISGLGAAKLLCYQLILMIAQQSAAQSRPKLELLENAFGNNKKIKLTASMRNTLSSIQEIIQQMVWKNTGKKRSGTQKQIIQSSPLYQGYVQFKHLLSDFDNQLSEQPQSPPKADKFSQKISSKKKDTNQLDSQSSQNQQNQALIQQLQQIVAKKQRRIKQLNDELQQNILQQKAQQDLIVQLESRNIDLKEEVKILNMKLGQKDTLEMKLQQKIEYLKQQAMIRQKQQQQKRTFATEKTIKTKFTLDDQQQPQHSQTTTKKEYMESFSNDKQLICALCQPKKDISIEDVNGMRRLLLLQAISIEALI